MTNQLDVFPGKETMASSRMQQLLSIWPLLILLLMLWPPWPLLPPVVGVGVDPPSASNSMSMASSLLQTLAENDFDETPLSGLGTLKLNNEKNISS